MKHINFNLFDGAHTENFCSAALHLAMESDEEVRKAVVEMLLKPLGEDAPKYEVSRPPYIDREKVTKATDGSAANRPDLTLYFETGSGEKREVIVEVKTSISWPAKEVSEQMERYRKRNPEVILLAPRRLCEKVESCEEVKPLRYVSWEDLLRDLRKLEPREEPVKSAIKHLEEHVERSGGIPDMDIEDLEEKIHHIAAVRSFLQECIGGIKATLKEKNHLWLTGCDGEPRLRGGLKYHGMSVGFNCEGNSYALGVYKFVEVPEGDYRKEKKEYDQHPESYWLQAIDVKWTRPPVVFSRLDLKDLSLEKAKTLREGFIGEWETSLLNPKK